MTNNDPYGQPGQVPPGPPPPPAYGAPAPAGYPGAPAPQQKTNTMAIIALVGGILTGIVGIICGHIALNQIKKTGEQGRGLALAGLIIGYVVTAFWVLYLIIVIFLVVVAFSVPTYY